MKSKSSTGYDNNSNKLINHARAILVKPLTLLTNQIIHNGVGFSSDTALRFAGFSAGFVRCNSHTIMKSFLKKIALEFTGNLHTNRTKLPENSRAVLLRNDFIIVRLSHLRNPANRRAASDEKPTPGVFPRQLKIARAKPLFKKGDQ